MKKNHIIILCFLITGLAATIFRLNWGRYADIDEWSQNLSAEKVGWVQVAKEYGTEKYSYMLHEYEYEKLITLLESVTEDTCSRKEKSSSLEDGYRLALFYDEKLWLFKCCKDEIVSLMFEDAETGAYYGCEGKQLYIQNSELWNYIITTTDTQAVQ